MGVGKRPGQGDGGVEGSNVLLWHPLVDEVDNPVYNRNMSRKGTSMATPLHIAVIGGVTVDADISATELSSRYAAALTALPQPAVDLPGILRKRSIVHTEWHHSLHFPTGRSLADWQQALATAHGAPVCF
ncbi:hypothetical protein [Corynebacterium diphtheriae]|uniref:hypothetical protein n=1 Tax=Corynebacterium diphtheriae TaxID=1717 RepID=UPI002F2639F5